jgi:coenzyme F420-reducing hydrogenase beta subunit
MKDSQQFKNIKIMLDALCINPSEVRTAEIKNQKMKITFWDGHNAQFNICKFKQIKNNKLKQNI